MGSDPGNGVRPRYFRPESLDELLGILQADPDARLLAGGTDLLVRMRKSGAAPRAIVDLKRVAGLRDDVTLQEGVVRIGARAVMTEVAGNKWLREQFPALVEAALVVGSVQIRNRATISGNLCNASPAADTAPALIAYDASVNLIGIEGVRTLPLEQFFIGPGRTALGPGELVQSIDLPLPAERTGSAFGRLTRRHGVDLAIVNLCCVVRDSGDVRFAVGAMGPRPFAVNTRQDAPLEELADHASPISDLRAGADYRRAMLPVIAGRTLATALRRLQTSRARGASGPPQASGWSGATGRRE